ncbi:MAG TPA: hypothetical protein DCY79_06265 [Planctomycetaceae bacterium]|nr:hypothetical protein [Planctomycetaceae bacterium]
MARTSVEHGVRNWTLPEEFALDPVAARARWTPCRPHLGNSHSEERTLVVVDDRRLVWKVRRENFRLHARLTCLFLPVLLTGIYFMGMIWFEPPLGLFMFPFSAVFVFAGGLIVWSVYSQRCGRVFDRDRGYSIGTPLHPFSTPHHNPAETQKAIKGRPRSGKLTDIYAVQVISKFVRVQVGGGGSYGKTHGPLLSPVQDHGKLVGSRRRSSMGLKDIQSYELNIVLQSGFRVNVIDHNDPAVIRAEAATLATFLTVPVWDDSDRGFWRFLLSEKMTAKMAWLWTIKRAAPGNWLFLRGADRRDIQWELGYAHLLDYVEAKGHARVDKSKTSNDYFFNPPFPLGEWVAQQRAKVETLSADRRKRLEMLPGWTTSDLNF